VPQTEFETDRLAFGQVAQAVDELQQFDRRGEGAVPGRRDTVTVLRNTPCSGNFRADLVLGQNPAMPGFGALAQLDFDHLHLRAASLSSETLRIEGAVIVTTAKITAAQLPDQITTVLKVIGTDAALP